MTHPVDIWKGDIGDAYVDRSLASPATDAQLARVLASILGDRDPASVLDVGCNVGRTLRALRHITTAELHGVEPNDKARAIAADLGIAEIHDGDTRSLPYADGAVELVLTMAVLIHVPDADLEASYRELHRVSSRWILTMEYFSQSPQQVRWRDQTDVLWKRDFGGLWLDWFPELRLDSYGFLWKRATGIDDVTWWLFEKR